MANWTRHDTRALIEAAEERPCISVGVVKSILRHHAETGLIEMMARLERFADDHTVPFIWGVSDCALLIADWVVANGYSDPAAHLRGQYKDEQSCSAILEPAGGLSTIVADCAARAGLTPILEPRFGCVAVIGSAHNRHRQWAAIWQGHKWMVRWVSPDGRPTWALFAAKPLSMWAV